jgi:DNA repair exonuclease SbcCD ATPase subunit
MKVTIRYVSQRHFDKAIGVIHSEVEGIVQYVSARFDEQDEKYMKMFSELEEKFNKRFDEHDAKFDDIMRRLDRIEYILEKVLKNHEDRLKVLEST